MKELTMRGAKNGMALVLPDNRSRLKLIGMLCFWMVTIGASAALSVQSVKAC